MLAGGFKQPGLAVKHFRLARILSPNAAPPPRLITPEVGVAFREAAASLLARALSRRRRDRRHLRAIAFGGGAASPAGARAREGRGTL